MKMPNIDLDPRLKRYGALLLVVPAMLGAFGMREYMESKSAPEEPVASLDVEQPIAPLGGVEDTDSAVGSPEGSPEPILGYSGGRLKRNPNRNTKLQWPIKPFDKPHVIRSTFGEPRGYFDPPNRDESPNGILDELEWDDNGETRLLSESERRLHVGVDITAKAGTPVYSLLDGVAGDVGPNTERVSVGQFEYTHLVDRVPNGTRVQAFKTVIGRVSPEAEHVHFNMVAADGKRVNPLSARGFVGYTDNLAPNIKEMSFYDSQAEEYQPGTGGKVEMFVNAYDRVSVGGTNDGVYRRVGLYAVKFRLVDLTDDKIMRTGNVWKFDRLPSNELTKRVYFPTSTRHRYSLKSGKLDKTLFEYRLNPDEPIELKPDHKYKAVVVANDAFGNNTKKVFSFRG